MKTKLSFETDPKVIVREEPDSSHGLVSVMPRVEIRLIPRHLHWPVEVLLSCGKQQIQLPLEDLKEAIRVLEVNL